jgi:hypothetical protein
MPPVDLPIRKPFANVDSTAKVLLVDEAVDCHYENTGEGKYAIRRRPGHTLFSDLAQSSVVVSGLLKTGQGIFWSDRFAAAFAVANGKLFKINSAGTATQLTGSTLNTATRCIFAEAQDLALAPFIYIAHGGTLRYTKGTTLDAPTDALTPTAATYVASLNNRIFANNGGQDFYITDTNPATNLLDPFYWSSTDNPWRTAQKADLLKAIHAAWGEVSLWGTQTVEPWQEDGVTPISPLVGATSEVGIEAEYSLAQAVNTLFALVVINGKRAVVRMENRAPKIISDDIDKELQDLSTVSDANGALCFAGGLNAYVLTFPTENKAWAYDLKEGIWTKWGQWDSNFARYNSFPIIGSCYAKPWNKHLFQATNGNIYSQSRATYQDAGSEIRTLIRTGWVNHGTSRRKRSNRLFVKVKAYNPTSATVLLRHRDDGRPEWGPFMALSIGSESEQTHYIPLTRMGIYRSRQYEIIMTDNADLAFCGMQEDVQELAS